MGKSEGKGPHSAPEEAAGWVAANNEDSREVTEGLYLTVPSEQAEKPFQAACTFHQRTTLPSAFGCHLPLHRGGFLLPFLINRLHPSEPRPLPGSGGLRSRPKHIKKPAAHQMGRSVGSRGSAPGYWAAASRQAATAFMMRLEVRVAPATVSTVASLLATMAAGTVSKAALAMPSVSW